MLNHSLSVRSRGPAGASDKGAPKRHRFNLDSLRGQTQPDLAKKLYKLIKSESHIIEAYESAGRERASLASQLSEWGESTNDDAISEVSDKLGVLMSEVAEQEDGFSNNLEESRGVLKTIRNTEKSVAPSRDNKAKVADEIAKMKYKDPQSPKIQELEQELVRAEAQSLVAEAQLTNLTRQKFKEAYDIHMAAVIERAEKQIILAQHARRLLMLVDDTPVVPGDSHQPFQHYDTARQILNDAEDDLRAWNPSWEEIGTNAGHLGSNAMPHEGAAPVEQHAVAPPTTTSSVAGDTATTTTASTAEHVPQTATAA